MENKFFSGFDISATGLQAERIRMEIISQNLANARSTRVDGEIKPYTRKEVIFESVLDGASSAKGVRVKDIVDDTSTPFVPVYQPGHPDADQKGYVLMPNVETAFEMVDLITAVRAYESNLAAMKAYQEMAQKTITLG